MAPASVFVSAVGDGVYDGHGASTGLGFAESIVHPEAARGQARMPAGRAVWMRPGCVILREITAFSGRMDSAIQMLFRTGRAAL
jgi:hypothetical protein